jgi:SAM-dependent methyltransferase
MTAPAQRQGESHLRAWQSKPLLRQLYAAFFQRITALIVPQLPGRIVELGAGVGNLKSVLPRVITSDLAPEPWADLVCDAYELPFADGSLSHLVLLDVFHHLEAPNAFLREARRVLTHGGRVILLEPYISLSSFPVYALLHHEPVAALAPVNLATDPPRPRGYYAAQGNATRLFFRGEVPGWAPGWEVFHRRAFSDFAHLFSGGYSKPSFYPARCLQILQRCDATLSRWPRLFGARCLVGLTPKAA